MYFSLTLDNLESQNEYLVSLDVSVCFESGSACDVSMSVLKDSKLPKMTCDWTAGLGGILICKTSSITKIICPAQFLCFTDLLIDKGFLWGHG